MATIATPPTDQPSPSVSMNMVMIGVIGIVGFLGTIVMITEPLVALALLLVFGGLTAAFTLARVGRTGATAMLHLGVAIILVLSASGLCASGCGTINTYEHIGPIPTAWLGIALHLFTATSLTISRRSTGQPKAQIINDLATALSILLIGVSGFFAILLIGLQAWCTSCVASHLLMLVQAVIIGRSPWTRRHLLHPVFALTLLLLGGLGINSVFHHRLVPDFIDNDTALLSYLRSHGITAQAPVDDGFTTWRTDEQDAAAELHTTTDTARAVAEDIQRGNEAAVAARLGSVGFKPDAAIKTPLPRNTIPAIQDEATPAVQTGVTGAFTSRDPSVANLIGASSAPITIHAILDPTCPSCGTQWAELAQLRPQIDAGSIALRVHLPTRMPADEPIAAIMHAAGIIGQRAYWNMLNWCFVTMQGRKVTSPETLAAAKRIAGGDRIKAVIQTQPQAVRMMNTDARTMLGTVAGGKLPTILIYHTGNPRPERTFNRSFASIAQLSLAIASMSDNS